MPITMGQFETSCAKTISFNSFVSARFEFFISLIFQREGEGKKSMKSNHHASSKSCPWCPREMKSVLKESNKINMGKVREMEKDTEKKSRKESVERNQWTTCELFSFAIYIIDAKKNEKISNVKTLFCDHIDLQSRRARGTLCVSNISFFAFSSFFSRQKVMFKRLIYC